MRTSKSFQKLTIMLALIVLGAAVLSERVAGQDGAWQMTRADYGHKSQRTDVTDLVQDLFSRGGVKGRIAVSNQTMGSDPAPGKDKSLRIFARNRRGEEHEFDYNEGSFVEASMFAVRNDDWDDHSRGNGPGDRDSSYSSRDREDWNGLQVIRGFYGVQRRTANVTEVLRSMVRDDRLTLNVNNDTLGGDPATGADKVLIVIYRYQGKEQAAAVREGYTLSLP
jgi:hypothetical protein